MCYTNRPKCWGEGHHGECMLFSDEKKFLKEKYGFYCIEDNLFNYNEEKYNEIKNSLREYRESIEIMEKLTGGVISFQKAYEITTRYFKEAERKREEYLIKEARETRYFDEDEK